MIRRLPAFQGYSIDGRLKEFRKVEWDRLPEFIAFDSEIGRKVLADMENRPEAVQTYQDEDPSGMDSKCPGRVIRVVPNHKFDTINLGDRPESTTR